MSQSEQLKLRGWTEFTPVQPRSTRPQTCESAFYQLTGMGPSQLGHEPKRGDVTAIGLSANQTDALGRRFIVLSRAGDPPRTGTTCQPAPSKGRSMKKRIVLITAFTSAVFVVGCKPSYDVSNNAGTNAPQFEQVKKETKEAAQTAKDYAFAQKDEFVAKMKADLADLNRQMDALGDKIEKSTGPARDEAKAKLQALRDQSSDMNKKLEDVKSATESTWDDVKAGFRKGYNDMKDSFKQARQWVADKISP